MPLLMVKQSIFAFAVDLKKFLMTELFDQTLHEL